MYANVYKKNQRGLIVGSISGIRDGLTGMFARNHCATENVWRRQLM